MIKIIAKYEITIEGKTFTVLMDHDTSLTIAKEMAFALVTYWGNVQAQAQIEAQAKIDEESKVSHEIQSDPPPEITPVTEERHV